MARLAALLREHGGALLSDAAGLGKTYVALAVARMSGAPLVVAPAALAEMWRSAFDATDIKGDFVSFEALSRHATVARHYDVVIIDEAHNVRNPCTRRYAEVARIATLAPVLLLSATPIHNTRDDVSALIAIFMGSRAYSMSVEDLSRFIVRRTATTTAAPMPRVHHATPRILPVDDRLINGIVGLPPAVPPRDGDNAPALVKLGLLRQLVSSEAALEGALRRRLARGAALVHALDSGRYPTRTELSAWVCSDDSVQLAFPELLPLADDDTAQFRAALVTHMAALRAVLDSLTPHRDTSRADFVSEVAAAHPDSRIVVFTSYADTARSTYAALERRMRCALLTSSGVTISSGHMSREELLAAFGPHARGTREPPDAARIDILITTDLLSEGVNLQGARRCDPARSALDKRSHRAAARSYRAPGLGAPDSPLLCCASATTRRSVASRHGNPRDQARNVR